MIATHFVYYKVESNPLTIYIEGGNRLHAYSSELII